MFEGSWCASKLRSNYLKLFRLWCGVHQRLRRNWIWIHPKSGEIQLMHLWSPHAETQVENLVQMAKLCSSRSMMLKNITRPPEHQTHQKLGKLKPLPENWFQLRFCACMEDEGLISCPLPQAPGRVKWCHSPILPRNWRNRPSLFRHLCTSCRSRNYNILQLSAKPSAILPLGWERHGRTSDHPLTIKGGASLVWPEWAQQMPAESIAWLLEHFGIIYDYLAKFVVCITVYPSQAPRQLHVLFCKKTSACRIKWPQSWRSKVERRGALVRTANCLYLRLGKLP